MQTSINLGILDNDPKGKSGRGTKFYMDIKVTERGKEPVNERYEYFLLDVIEKKIDLVAIRKPYFERQRAFDDEQERQEKDRKNQEKQQRSDAVKSNPELDAIIDVAIAGHPKAVAEFKSGKEKALNAIVGFIMKEIKAKNIEVVDAAFTINALLKKKCQ